MKISIYDPPYAGVLNYIQNKKSSGLNADLSRSDPSCAELMSSILGIKNNGKEAFKRIEVAARLISDDIIVYEPPVYKATSHDTVETLIFNIAYKSTELIDKLSASEKISFYQSSQKRQDVIDESIRQLVKWDNYYFKEIWIPLDSEAKWAICSIYHRILLDYYPIDFIDGIKGNSLFLSKNPQLNSIYSISQGKISSSNILAILAISGIETVLPKIYTDNIDVIEEIKESHKDEREDYIVFLRDYINECYLGIKAGDYKDVWDYAEFKSNNDLLIKLHNFERSVAGSDKKLIRDTTTNLANRSVSIAQSVLSGNFIGAGWSVLEALVSSIKGGTSRSNISEQLPVVSYAFKIKERV